MSPFEMSQEREDEIRSQAMRSGPASPVQLTDVLAELDATRAALAAAEAANTRLARAENAYAEERALRDRLLNEIASAQADALALREALERACVLCDWAKDTDCFTAVQIALSRSPSSTDALRSLLIEAARETIDELGDDDAQQEWTDEHRAAYFAKRGERIGALVSRILGPAPTEGTKR